MLNRRVKVILVTLAMSLALASFTSGCALLKKDEVTETEAQTQTETETETQSETETETETESETELQKDIAYTSQDKSIRITLPDSTWKVKQDADEMRVFSSGSDAMINIVHAANANALKNLTVYESEEALKTGLTKQYPEANSFEVVDFVQMSTPTLKTYEYVVKYNATSMWAYSITYGIMAENEAYVISGTVTDDNRVLMEAVKKAVESFTVLRNATFNSISGTVVSNKESETESEIEAGAEGELSSLVDYGTTAKLYASDIVHIRLQPSTEADSLGFLNKGEEVTVIGETPQWFKVNVLGHIGYVNKAFLVYSAQTEQSETPSSEASGSQQVPDSTKVQAEMNSYVDYGTSYTYYTTATVNLRAQPGTETGVIGGVNGGTAVSVIGETANWFMVSVNGTTGYISKSYISSSNPSDTGTSGSTGGSTDGSTGSSGGSTNTGTGTLSGTIQSISSDTIVIRGDDGNSYTINYMDASVDSAEGIYEGIYIVAAVDYSKTSGGTYYATAVNGY